MKTTILTLTTFILTLSSIYAQNVGIGDASFTPEASAMLDVKSTTKGMLTPRMTEVQRDAISNPATGLLIFQIDNASGFYYEDGATWQSLIVDSGVSQIGNVAPFAGSIVPMGYLLCDGSAVSRTTYADLFAVVGTAWGIGDGSTTFNLPDLRGRFMRGVDAGAGNDPNAAVRTAFNGGNAGDLVGSYQIDEFKNHSHGLLFS